MTAAGSPIAAPPDRAGRRSRRGAGTGRVGRRLMTPMMPHMAAQATDADVQLGPFRRRSGDGRGRRRPADRRSTVASSALGASTITRISGSVPLARTSTRPVSPRWRRRLGDLDRQQLGDVGHAARRRGTLTSTCGNCVIAAGASSASVRPERRSTSSSTSAVSMPSPVVARSGKITWPDCSPPSECPPSMQRLEHVAVADRGLDDLDPGVGAWRDESRDWSSP